MPQRRRETSPLNERTELIGEHQYERPGPWNVPKGNSEECPLRASRFKDLGQKTTEQH